MKRVLVIGSSSFIGSHVAKYLRDDYRVFGTYHTRKPLIDNVSHFKLEIDPSGTLETFLLMIQPEIIIYCASVIDDIQCSADPVRAIFVNADAPLYCSRYLERFGGRLIYLSSSKVFSGHEGNYTEADDAHPTSGYGNTKLQAEDMLLRHENCFVLRLGTVFGIGSRNQPSAILSRILGELWHDRELALIMDEYRSFVGVDQVCRAIGTTIDCSAEGAGLYQVSTGERETYYTFGKTIAVMFGLNAELLKPVTGQEFNEKIAKRPIVRGNDLSLQNELYCQSFSQKIEPIDRSLRLMRDQLRRGIQ